MELEDTSKEKIINAIRYFCRETKNLTETKLYKLLYFLDFLHFKEIGRPVTDLDYFAWDFGPVPAKLFFEIKEKQAPKDILQCIVEERDDLSGKLKSRFFKTKEPPNLEVFSEREIKLLEKVAYIFRDAAAKDMTEITHLKNTPYEKTVKSKGKKKKIDYFLALDDDAKVSEDDAQERDQLSKEMRRLFGGEG